VEFAFAGVVSAGVGDGVADGLGSTGTTDGTGLETGIGADGTGLETGIGELVGVAEVEGVEFGVDVFGARGLGVGVTAGLIGVLVVGFEFGAGLPTDPEAGVVELLEVAPLELGLLFEEGAVEFGVVELVLLVGAGEPELVWAGMVEVLEVVVPAAGIEFVPGEVELPEPLELFGVVEVELPEPLELLGVVEVESKDELVGVIDPVEVVGVVEVPVVSGDLTALPAVPRSMTCLPLFCEVPVVF
jgi:hypothetical protein